MKAYGLPVNAFALTLDNCYRLYEYSRIVIRINPVFRYTAYLIEGE